MLFSDSPDTGGFNLVGPSLIGRELWVGLVCILWSSWILVLLYAIVKLYYGRVSWKWLYPPAFIAVMLSFSESLGLSSMARRTAMHIYFEPLILLITLIMVGRYIAQRVSKGEELDFLSCVVLTTACMFMIRLLLMLDHRMMLSRPQSHVLFFFYMGVVISSYFLLPRMRAWMRRLS
jgi:hypothetical protein